ncbi:ABC transporter permease [Gynurincola endophyticus]|uniref:ABC transporter permease n=1 Tax=Gynurincola endophyticus TaxID=2479004 RepID=UPI000F8EF75C|nr:ABC transporter permease [Gynurincola endophyticus]
MNKTLIVAKREFLSRVQKKTFLLTTILLPLLIIGLYAAGIYFSVSGNDSFKVIIADPGKFIDDTTNINDATFTYSNQPENEVNQQLTDKKIDGYIFIPENYDPLSKQAITVKSRKAVSFSTQESIQRKFNQLTEQKKLAQLNIDTTLYNQIKSKTKFDWVTVSDDPKQSGKINSGLSYGLGYGMGLFIYFILFIYGSMVMRGVMEEKVSRIAEVIVSSVRPFQLLMGKIIGIGAVGVVQFLIWAILIITLSTVFNMTIGADQVEQLSSVSAEVKETAITSFMKSFESVNVPLLAVCFLFYFLGGYLLYSSLFAAVGCAVNEDPQDAQSLMMPITLPIIFGIIILNKAVSDPYSTISVFGSLFPLTSPIVMMGRLAHGVPMGVTYWELGLSLLFLILGFLFTTWLSGRIYRVGILMYGKKITWKELIKWGFQKNI